MIGSKQDFRAAVLSVVSDYGVGVDVGLVRRAFYNRRPGEIDAARKAFRRAMTKAQSRGEVELEGELLVSRYGEHLMGRR